MSGLNLAVSAWLALASAVSGVVGTLILIAASYAPPPVPSASSFLPGDDPVERQKVLRDIARQARQTRHRQRVGLAFLCLGFLLQGIAILWPK
jgi:hypothetical protein